MSRPSIFDAAGGEAGFLALATAHHERCLNHPVLNHPFSHPGHPRHVERLASYWAEVFGGPPRFSESCGGHSGMLEMHARMGAHPELGEAFVECFVLAADDAGLPADPELRAALRSYMEWAVSEVMSWSSLREDSATLALPREPEDSIGDSVVPTDLPTPRWSWAGPDVRD